jgi:hypothetical protein
VTSARLNRGRTRAVPHAMTVSSRIRPGVATPVMAGALAQATAGPSITAKSSGYGN